MKKCLSLLLCILTVCLLLSISANAIVPNTTLSEDFQTLTLGDVTYSRANTLSIDYFGYEKTVQIDLGPEMDSSIASAVAYLDSEQLMAEVDVLYNDGSRLSIGFINDSHLQLFQELYNAKSGDCIVNAYWATIDVSLDKLKTTPATMESLSTYWADHYYVEMVSEGSSLAVIKGSLLVDGDAYYYLDHEEMGIVERRNFATDTLGAVQCYKITDPQTIETLDNFLDESEDVTLWGSDLTEVVSAFMLGLIFGFLPAIVLIMGIILTIRCKGFYKKAWAIISILCAAELLVFILLVLLL